MKDILKAHLRSALMMAKNLTVCDKTDLELIDIVADQLLLRGVVVPPCKVGDAVYYNHPELKETCPAKVIEITINYYTPSDPMLIKIEFFSKLIGIHTIKLSCFAFKKGCHNTKEEAEKALRG